MKLSMYGFYTSSKAMTIFMLLMFSPLVILFTFKDILVEKYVYVKSVEIVSEIERQVIINRKRAIRLSEVILIKQLDFDCGELDKKILSDRDLLPATIRVLQLELKNGDKCSSLDSPIKINHSKLIPTAHHDLFISTTINKFPHKRQILYIYKYQGNTFTSLINRSVINERFNEICFNCFKIDMTHKGLPTVIRGSANIDQDAHKYEYERDFLLNIEGETFEFSISINAGDLLFEEIQDELNLFILLFGLFAGSMANIIYLARLNAKVSHKRVIALAIKNSEFIPYYQPIINSISHEVVGQEVLVRWITGSGEVIYPDSFIPYAEDSGLIVPITEQLLDKVYQDLDHLAGWSSINIVAAHLEMELLSKWFEGKPTIDKDKICFELTERKRIVNIELAKKEINKLIELGTTFKLDDFGTGYGGFNYLQELGLRSIKIDKMFIDTIGTDDLKRNVLDAIIAFGKEAKMEVIAEGVETKEQVDYLVNKGIFLIQGYYYANPMPFDELIEFYKTF